MKPDDLNLTANQRVFLRAAEIVRRAHCKGAYARREDGTGVLASEQGAVSFCFLGAVGRAQYELKISLDFPVLSGLAFPLNVAEWNDAPERTGEEVAQKLEEIAFS